MRLSGPKGAWLCRFLAHSSLKLCHLEKKFGGFLYILMSSTYLANFSGIALRVSEKFAISRGFFVFLFVFFVCQSVTQPRNVKVSILSTAISTRNIRFSL